MTAVLRVGVVAAVVASAIGANSLFSARMPSASAHATAAVPGCKFLQKGPEGQAPSKAGAVKVTAGQFARLKAKHKTFRVATFWQVINPGNTELMIAGLQAQFKSFAKHGVHVKITAMTDSGFDASKQVDQINTLVATKPDAMVGILDDQVAEAGAVKNVMQHHIPLIMWDVDAKGVYPTSIVTANGRQAGCQIADITAKNIGNKGDVASLPMKIRYYPTDQRVAGFNARMKKAYPKIHIVAHDGATVFADGQAVGEGILTRSPNVKAIFVSWQDPAMGVVSAVKTLGRTNVIVNSMDMAPNIDLEIAKCGIVRATAPQLAYDIGQTEAKLAVQGILKDKVPKYVVLNDPIVTHKNLLQVYPKVFHTSAPAGLVKAYVKKNCG
jgi:ribose transport system substrate-binding protein